MSATVQCMQHAHSTKHITMNHIKLVLPSAHNQPSACRPWQAVPVPTMWEPQGNVSAVTGGRVMYFMHFSW